MEDTEFNWTEEDLAKISNGNILRAMREMENVRDNLANRIPEQDWIPESDFNTDELTCNSAFNDLTATVPPDSGSRVIEANFGLIALILFYVTLNM